MTVNLTLLSSTSHLTFDSTGMDYSSTSMSTGTGCNMKMAFVYILLKSCLLNLRLPPNIIDCKTPEFICKDHRKIRQIDILFYVINYQFS